MNATGELFDDPKKRFSDFALKDYELKVAYLSSHFQRMWTRFNYFVVLQAALIGGKTIFGDRELSVWGVMFGITLSLVWYVMGAEDRYLVQLYRHQIEEAAQVIASGVGSPAPRPITPVGHVPDPRFQVKPSITAWRVDPMSTTRLAAWIPLLALAVWIGMLGWIRL